MDFADIPRAAKSVQDSALVLGECERGHWAWVPSWIIGENAKCTRCHEALKAFDRLGKEPDFHDFPEWEAVYA